MMDVKGRVFSTKQAMPGHRLVEGGGKGEAAGWNGKRREEEVRPLSSSSPGSRAVREGGGGTGRKKEHCSLSPCPPSPPPNRQVPESFGEKTSLQTHSDFW